MRTHPNDGPLLIAAAAALLRAGADHPLAGLETVLARAPDWIEGHKALVRLKVEAGDSEPFAVIEAALRRLPRHARLWLAYLGLLGGAGRHGEAADHAARLRRAIADLPGLRLIEARHRGLAGESEAAAALLASVPADHPERDYEAARNALRQDDLATAATMIERALAAEPADMRVWALAELCWRRAGHPNHDWLVPGEALFRQCHLGLSETELADLAEVLRMLHVGQSAPLGQSVEGGTQTYGHLHLRRDPAIGRLFAAIEAVLSDYLADLPPFAPGHPLAALGTGRVELRASWSIRLTAGGRHVPHLHDTGRVSSAAHIVCPASLQAGEGVLELGTPPEDLPQEQAPFARFAPHPGQLVLFPSFVYHSTTRFCAGERLSVAFDAA
ncbi:MAG: putative 2OG-Fe(II) oxygenase [Erythrobacter sp.]